MSAFWEGLVTALVASWPPAAGGMWLTWYLARRKVAQITDQQTATIKQLTKTQTRELLGSVPPDDRPADPDRYA